MSSLDETYRANAQLLQAMAHPIRLEILEHIFDLELPVNALVHQMDRPQAVISTQLAVLRKAGLVDVRAVGTGRLYRLADKRILEVMKSLNPKLP